jgi:hypothetical protein
VLYCIGYCHIRSVPYQIVSQVHEFRHHVSGFLHNPRGMELKCTSARGANTEAYGMGINYYFASFEAVHLYPLDPNATNHQYIHHNSDGTNIQYDSTIDIGSGCLY